MIKILKIKPKDLEWMGKRTSDEYTTELIAKYGSVLSGEKDIRELTNYQYEELTRLQVEQFMSMEDVSDTFMNIYLDEKEHVFFVNFDALEERMKQLEYQLADEAGEEYEDMGLHYFPIYKLLLNQDLRDPYVHYDEQRNLFSLPSKVLLTNDKFVNEIKFEQDISKLEMHELEDILFYLEEEDIYVYTLDMVDIDTEENEVFKEHWNYAVTQDMDEHKDEFMAYDSEGNPCGRVFDISIFDKEKLICVLNEDGNELIEEGDNFDFNALFGGNVKNDIMLIYITEPTDGFALSTILEDGSQKVVGLSVKFSDYNNIIDKFVYVKEEELLYIPIRVMNLSAIQTLHKLGFSWRKEDIESIGYTSFTSMSDELKQQLINEAMEEADTYNLEYAVKHMLKKMVALGNISDNMINYDAFVKTLLETFYDRLRESGRFTPEQISDISDNFNASDFGVLPEIEEDEDLESDDEDTLNF